MGENETSNWTVQHHASVTLLTLSPATGQLDRPESLRDLNTILDRLAAQTDRVNVVVLTGGLGRILYQQR
jgi:enoyl-CoA hydratase/carnithine racemase